MHNDLKQLKQRLNRVKILRKRLGKIRDEFAEIAKVENNLSSIAPISAGITCILMASYSYQDDLDYVIHNNTYPSTAGPIPATHIS